MTAARAAAALLVVLLPYPAWAHAAIPGIGGAYAAFWHTLTELPAPLTLIGLGLLLGLHGTDALKWAWGAFFFMTIVGLALAMGIGIFIDPELPMLLIALFAGLYAASGLRLTAALATVLGAFGGYFLGVFIAPSPASWPTRAYAIAGGLIAANFALVFLVAAVESVRTRWQLPWITIALRVVASWIAAIAALVTALSIR
jgi:hypothetical protein